MTLDNMTWDEKWNFTSNPTTTADALRHLIKDGDWRIRENVATHPKASNKILITLFEYEKSSKDPCPDVIRGLYYRANLPAFAKRVIETLYGDWL